MKTPKTNPWFVRLATTAGRPIVLMAALAMSAPGEHQLAVNAGWSPVMSWLMPLCVSLYAATAAAIASTRPKGAPGRISALWGAGAALGLAMAAQVISHLMASGYMSSSAVLVAGTSAVPPLVVGHLLHLAAAPRMATESLTDTKADSLSANDQTEPQMAIPGLDQDGQSPSVGMDSVSVADEFWNDFEDAADDSPEAISTPPSVADINAAIEVLASVHGRPVTGEMMGQHFGVSARSGRRYLSLATVSAA